MFGDAEHYKYLTNEADLNNVGDDSIALTPKTPKKVIYLSIIYKLISILINESFNSYNRKS